jgi:cytoskeletal protein CcmA (bactofilin family)
MFSGKRQKEAEKNAAVADKVSIIAEGMTVSGDIDAAGDIRIDGFVTGNISCSSKVVVIASGRVEGSIRALNVDVHGTVLGDITAADQLSLKSNCRIKGNLIAKRLQIEPNALFNGHCTMTRETKASVTKDGLLFHDN